MALLPRFALKSDGRTLCGFYASKLAGPRQPKPSWLARFNDDHDLFVLKLVLLGVVILLAALVER